MFPFPPSPPSTPPRQATSKHAPKSSEVGETTTELPTTDFISSISPALLTQVTTVLQHIYANGLQSSLYSDLTITAFDKKWKLHRLIIMHNSFFKGLLDGPWSKSDTEMCLDFGGVGINLGDAKSKELEITGIDELNTCITEEAFKIGLEWIYGAMAENVVSEKNILSLLTMSTYLDISTLTTHLHSHLTHHLTNPDYLQFIPQYLNYFATHDTPISSSVLESIYTLYCRQGFDEPLRRTLVDLDWEWLNKILTNHLFWCPEEWERYRLIVWVGLQKWNRIVSLPKNQAKPLVNSFLSSFFVLLVNGPYYVHMPTSQLHEIIDEIDSLPLTKTAKKKLELNIKVCIWDILEFRGIITSSSANETELFSQNERTNHANETAIVSKGRRRPGRQEDHLTSDYEFSSLDELDPQSRTNWDSYLNDLEDEQSEDDSSSIYSDQSRRTSLQSPTLTQYSRTTPSKTSTSASNSLLPIIPQQDTTIITPISLNNLVLQASDAHLNARFPPFRFSVEFKNPLNMGTRVKLYSKPVFYAGSKWNVYIQRYVDNEDVKMGVYLHRCPKEYLGNHTHNDSGLDLNVTTDTSLFASFSTSSSSLDDLTGGVTPEIHSQSTTTSDSNRSMKKPIELQSYIDPREKVNAWFKICCYSGDEQYEVWELESKPDLFWHSHSWGWKSQKLARKEYLVKVAELGKLWDHENVDIDGLDKFYEDREKKVLRFTVLMGLV
ncbi:hypothetical protein BKA69DRAFT_1168133 [Paraphysoderma sedebokerense]|nr:hypothetical protein BKA69DRAFT_1168133 [Paraphysoderma sedebokerense]